MSKGLRQKGVLQICGTSRESQFAGSGESQGKEV